MKIKLTILLIMMMFVGSISAQPPGRMGGGPPPWLPLIDNDGNGEITLAEYKDAANQFFTVRDKNGNGVLEEVEMPSPRGGKPHPERAGVPPFLFLEIGEFNLSRREFEEKIEQKFLQTDVNKDGVIDREEVKSIRPVGEGRHQKKHPLGPENSPTAKFISAELRFGDVLVKNSPFSAEIVIENTRRLFDGSTVSHQNKGAIYRDGSGRTRREQSLDSIGAFSIVGKNSQAQKMIFINDFPAQKHYFLDLNAKTAFLHPLKQGVSPLTNETESRGKTESLGTKMMEGVSVEGKRTVIEIPVGQAGNDKPLQVVMERWYSAELQIVVMSKTVDPFAGEHVYKLVNIKKGEPASELFVVPKDFKIEKRMPHKKDDE